MAEGANNSVRGYYSTIVSRSPQLAQSRTLQSDTAVHAVDDIETPVADSVASVVADEEKHSPAVDGYLKAQEACSLEHCFVHTQNRRSTLAMMQVCVIAAAVADDGTQLVDHPSWISLMAECTHQRLENCPQMKGEYQD